MSSCIKDLYDYDLVEKCSKCGIMSLKSKFHKIKAKSNGYRSECITCRKKINFGSREKRDLYIKNRIKTDVNF